MPPNRRPPSASPSSSSHRCMYFLKYLFDFEYEFLSFLSFLASDTRTPSIATREPQRPQQQLNSFGRTPPTTVLGDVTNNNINALLPPSTFQPREVPVKKGAQTGVGFNFRTVTNDGTSSTPYSHIVTSVDNSNAIGAQGLRVNDYILSINDENVEYLNHEQLEDKLRRINNSETVRFLVTDGAVYRAYKQSAQNLKPKYDIMEQPRIPLPNTNLQQSRRQYRLQKNPEFAGYGFRVRSNQHADGTPHQIIHVEPCSPADVQGLRVGDYILRVNNQTVEHMNPTEFNNLMQNLVRNDNTRDGALLLEVMDEDTYRSINNLPPIAQSFEPNLATFTSDRRTPTRSTYDVYQPSTLVDQAYPKMRQCFIRVRNCVFF